MVERVQRGSMGAFSRGAELWMHQARLFGVAVWTATLIALVHGLLVAGGLFYRMSSSVERYAMERNAIGEARLTLMMTNAKMELYVSGAPQMLTVKEVVELTDEDAAEGWRNLRNALLIGALTAVGLTFALALGWWSYGRGKMQDVRLRGAQLVEGPELKTLLEERNDCSPYELAGVPMRKGSETLHTMIGGAQGTGKSQQFFRLMRQWRARGKRAIVYDPTGEFTQAFYREGRDILMNPLDDRSPNWNIWNEIERDYHFDGMANGLIPDPAESDPFWAAAGRMVLKDVYRVLGKEGRQTNADLYRSIATSNLEALHALLVGTAGATYVDPTTERTGMSLKMTVQNQLESFRFLRDTGKPFSIREWVQNEETDSWMFITARESMREALKPVLSLWIDTAIKAVLELEPIHRERLWFALDELPTLQKLDVLKLALTNTRKYGLCVVIGVQDFSQLKETYGQHLASTIISGCQTKLLLRVTDGEAAKLLAKLMGEAEIDEKEETVSYGLNSQRDGVSVFARRNLRDIVLTSQVLTLPDMTGYLTVPGDYPVARVSYGFEPNPKIAEGFIEREGFRVSFDSASRRQAAEATTTATGAALPTQTPRDHVPAAGDSRSAERTEPFLLDEDVPTAASVGNDEVVELRRDSSGALIDAETGVAVKTGQALSTPELGTAAGATTAAEVSVPAGPVAPTVAAECGASGSLSASAAEHRDTASPGQPGATSPEAGRLADAL